MDAGHASGSSEPPPYADKEDDGVEQPAYGSWTRRVGPGGRVKGRNRELRTPTLARSTDRPGARLPIHPSAGDCNTLLRRIDLGLAN